jgi:hypothetical protein
MRYQRRKLVRVKHVMRLGTGTACKAALQALGFSGRVNTANTLRVNLTIRRGVAALARRTWATARPRSTFGSASRVVARLLPLRAAAQQARAWRCKGVWVPLRQGNRGTDNARQPWRLCERGRGGPRSACSAVPCHRCLLEQAGKPETRCFLGLRGLMPSQRVSDLDLYRPVLPGKQSKLSPKTAAQGLIKLSPVYDSCTVRPDSAGNL